MNNTEVVIKRVQGTINVSILQESGTKEIKDAIMVRVKDIRKLGERR